MLRKTLVIIAALTAATVCAGELKLTSQVSHPVADYAARRLRSAFEQNPSFPTAKVGYSVSSDHPPESYQASVSRDGGALSIQINAGDARGLLHGSLTLIERLRSRPDALADFAEAARFPFRAIKFNLPWESYRSGEALSLHAETCRDLAFWEAFLDMMADNRFNALTLWSLHPFHLMVRNPGFPEACDLSDADLAGWQDFWHRLFAMAEQRGIETYLVNWNIFTSPAFAKEHGLAEYSIDASNRYFGEGERSETVKNYTRDTITQVIDTYPKLSGLGVSLGERMGGFSPEEREQWILDTFVAGMKAAKRPIRFIHRLPFSAGKNSGGSTSASTEQLTRNAIESIDLPTPVIAEVKFNWSHGHSTPKLVHVHGGKLGDTYWNPPPKNYQLAWMIRNEDFFALRWCQPDFIREHIRRNGHDYVGGYFIGSECYIPAKDYLTAPGFTDRYAFQRQWLYYMAWGRLLHNPDLPDEAFTNACRGRFGDDGGPLYQAITLGSRMPLRLASFFKGTWDFTLYSEGFLSINAKSNPQHFITVDDLIRGPVLDPDYLSIKDHVKATLAKQPAPEGKTSPPELARQAIDDSRQALEHLDAIPAPEGDLLLETADARAWAHLNAYFGHKLLAATAIHSLRKSGDTTYAKDAVHAITEATHAWEQLSATTSRVYREMPLAHIHHRRTNEPDQRVFHWKHLLPTVREEQAAILKELEQTRVLRQ